MTEQLVPDITPESHPDHWVVGHDFISYDLHRYRCMSHDRCGYNMVDIYNPDNRRNISEMAIRRTFWDVWNNDGVEWCQYGRVSNLKIKGREVE